MQVADEGLKVKAFDRWARKEGLGDDDLIQAAEEIISGRFEGDLGGSVVKKRVARTGGGKRAGLRVIVAYRSGASSRVFFLHGYAKNAKADITAREKLALQTTLSPPRLVATADSRPGELGAIVAVRRTR